MSRLFLGGLKSVPAFAGVLVLVTCFVQAQDLEPRAYANTPVGLNFLIAGYGYTAGGVAIDPALPIENAKVTVHSAILAYARSLDFFGKSAKVEFVLPYAAVLGTATVTGEFRDRSVSGFADPRIRFSFNAYGAPALSLKEFANYRQDTIFGISLEVTAPGGQYDSDKLLNLGTNRWSFKPEIGLSKALGPVTLELDGGIRFYTDNHNFFNGRVRQQDPIYSVQGHLIYSFPYGIWAAVDGTYYAGGRTSVNGIRDNNLQQNSRLGATLALPLSRYHSIKLYFSSGVSTRTGSSFDAAGIAWQTRFGGGF
ncbi:MAG: transporter [Gammaproteobacteria bacterium]